MVYINPALQHLAYIGFILTLAAVRDLPWSHKFTKPLQMIVTVSMMLISDIQRGKCSAMQHP